VRDLLEPLELTPEDPADSPLLRGNARWALSALFPDRAAKSAVHHADANSASYAALYGLYWLAFNLMSTAPLVLIVDDAHRCDEHSLRWLDFLLRRADDLPLLVLLAYRGEEMVEPAASVLSEIVAQPDCTVVDLDTLVEAEVDEVVANVLAIRPDSEFTRACATVTGGNPLLLNRLLDELHRSAVRPVAACVRAVEEVGRDVVATSVLARLSSQHEPVRKVAAAVAVLGAGAETGTVAALAEANARQVAEALAVLRHNNIVAPSEVDFVHDVVRSAVLDDLPTQELDSLRARAARLLNDAGRPIFEVADQLLRLSGLDELWMVEMLRDAAAMAERQGAPEVSVRYLRRVLDVELSEPERIRTQAELGRILSQIDPAAALPILRDVLAQVTDPDTYAPLAIQFATTAFSAVSYQEAIRVLAELLGMLSLKGGHTGSAEDRELAMLLESMLLVIGMGEKSTFDLVRDRARTRSLPEGNTSAERRLLAATSMVGSLSCEPREQLVERARRVLHFREIDADAWTARCALFGMYLADEVEEVLAGAKQALAAAKAEGALWSYSYSMAWYSRVRHFVGDVREAAADSQTAAEICEQALWGESTAAQFNSWASVLVEQGHVEKAEAVLDQINRAWFEEAILEWPLFLHARARARWFRGDRDKALELLLRCGKSLDDAGVVNPVFVPWRTDAARLLVELGRRSEAAELVERDGELAHRWGTARAIGVNLAAQGMVTDGQRAVELLTAAVEVLADSPARLEEARAQYHLGAALLRIDDVQGARKHLRGSADLATLCGSLVIAGTARELAVAAGGRVGQSADSPVDLLTGSEHRVTTMAAAGATNREIAEALFVTLRTVETHLTSAYRKLRVTRRAELSAALDESHPSRGAVSH
jgi:DNA-binding CsgD family transcriptional regulator